MAYLEEIFTLVHPAVVEPVILTDPDDDPVLYTALDGNADVLCTLNTDFHKPMSSLSAARTESCL